MDPCEKRTHNTADLSRSLLAAADLLGGGLRLDSDAEAAIGASARSVLDEVTSSLLTFARYMAPYLPASDFLPEHSLERSRMRTDVDLNRQRARQQLLRRSSEAAERDKHT